MSLTLLGALVVGAAPALALGQRGHVFSFSFGEPGTGQGQLLHPSGIAVNDTTGDVYVADQANNRVDEFKPKLGSTGGLVGEQRVAEFGVPFPAVEAGVALDKGIAVDNSSNEADPSKGDVYVVGTSHAESKAEESEPGTLFVYKFTPTGQLIAKLSKFKTSAKGSEAEPFEAVAGLAVDSSGTLFVSEESGEIYGFNDAEKNEGKSEVRSGLFDERPGFAVDSEDDFYVGTEGESEAAEQREKEESEKELHGEFQVVAKLEHTTGKVLSPELEAEDTTAVAVNVREVPTNDVSELNDVYTDQVSVAAGELVTTVGAFSPNGSLIQRFGAVGLKEGSGIAVDSLTGTVYVTDAASDRIDVFELEEPGRPQIDGLSAVPTPTVLEAQINASGADTRFHFEYGSGSCGVVGACAATPDTDLGEGFGDRATSAALPALSPGVYHYRVVATNEFGTVHSPEQILTILAPTSGLIDGRAWEMVSPSNKDGAEAEAITKEGGEIQASENGDAISYVADGPMPAEVQPDGSRSPEYTQSLSTRGPQGWTSQDIATPNSSAGGVARGHAPEYDLFSSDLALALVEPFSEGHFTGPIAKSPLSPPLASGEAQEKTIYLRADAPLAPDDSEAESYEAAKRNGKLMANPGYLALVSDLNAPGAEFGGGEEEGITFAGATPDLSDVVFGSYKAAPGLYEWESGGGVQLISALPGPEEKRVGLSPAEGSATLGDLNDGRHAISDDGARVFWTSKLATTTAEHLYVRDTVSKETLQLDVVQPKASGSGKARATFQTASADGSKVFFTDDQRLTSDSKAIETAPDLYVFELNQGSHVSGTLTDLSPEGINGESADVVTREAPGGGGGVLGASEDGAYVYFMANGALAPGAARGKCSQEEGGSPPAGTTCGLYVRHYNGTGWDPTTLIAPLSYEDRPDWGGDAGKGSLFSTTSRVSPNGDYLAFMSDRSLTGYDNIDVSESTGQHHDEEVYLYDAGSGRLTCASCDPTGERPVGVHDLGDADAGLTGEGIGLVVDRHGIWEESVEDDHWLAGSVPGWTPLDVNRALYQSRYLSDDGRLFFNSPDHLVPAATGGKEKVYEYEPAGVGSCHSEAGCVGLISAGTSEHESAFLDASADGDDVFFLTADRLAPQDVDSNFDVYDSHVCDPASPCLTAPSASPQACDETPELPCRPLPSSAPAFAGPAAVSPSDSGNVVQHGGVLASKVTKQKSLTRAQKLSAALKTCRKLRRKKPRVACESQARRRYGPKKTSKEKSVRRTGRGRKG